MASTIYLLQYNNYYNRQFKIEKEIRYSGTATPAPKCYYDYIVKYEHNGELKEGIFYNINFIPNDGVETQQVINWYGPNPDYLVVENDNNGEITRWFVLESTRTRGGQYALTLRRDLLADYFIQTISAPCFVNKAMLEINDSFIFNKENSTYNQIKIKEELLKDPAAPDNVAWLTAYIDKNHQFPELTVTSINHVDYYGKNSLPFNGDESIVFTLPSDEYGIKFRHQIRPWDYSDTIFYQLETEQHSSYNDKWKNLSPEGGGGSESNVATYNTQRISEVDLADYYNGDINTYLKAWTDKLVYNMINIAADYDLDQYLSKEGKRFISQNDYNKIKATSGKIVQEGGKTYRIQVKEVLNNRISANVASASELGQALVSQAPQAIQNVQEDTYKIYKNTNTLQYTYVEVSLDDTFGGKVTLTHAGHTFDQVYDIITMPIRTDGYVVNVYDINGALILQQNNTMTFNIITQLAANNKDAVYDIQLLPYCPLRNCLVEQVVAGIKLPHIVIDDTKFGVDYITEPTSEKKKGVVLYASTSRTNFNIPYYYEKANTALEKKVRSETEFFRLASPGYDTIFEFNAEKNNGIPSFNINMCLKPFSPFIHIAPSFGGLYGKDYQDMRGLTCNGDFSMSRVENLFATYELQNKNYQRMFDRDIQYMESTHDVTIGKNIGNLLFGSAQGAMVGAATGSVGGPGGAMVGAGIGAASAAVGSTINMVAKDIQYGLDVEYKKDRFQMNLQNIKALPNALSKISAFCQNNKVFPVLEFYRATREEQEALRNKIRYNGMTVNRIGLLREFLKNYESYIQGTVIRINDLNDDMHIATAINNEVQRGFFIDKRNVHIEL